MSERKAVKKVSPRNTKEELVSAYQELAKQLDERQSRAQEKAEEKANEEAVAVADSFSTGEIARQAGGLKAEVSRPSPSARRSWNLCEKRSRVSPKS